MTTLDLYLCEYALCGGFHWRLLRYMELFATWPQSIVWSSSSDFAFVVSFYQVSCYFLQLCLFLAASHPYLLIIIGCELWKQIIYNVLKNKSTQGLELRMWASALWTSHSGCWIIREKSIPMLEIGGWNADRWYVTEYYQYSFK